jgi:hypothetical protein
MISKLIVEKDKIIGVRVMEFGKDGTEKVEYIPGEPEKAFYEEMERVAKYARDNNYLPKDLIDIQEAMKHEGFKQAIPRYVSEECLKKYGKKEEK